MSTSYPTILKQFDTDSLEEFEIAIDSLKSSFTQHFNGLTNPLQGLLGIGAEVRGVISVPVLDQNLTKHIKGISNELLLDLLGITLTNAGFDKFETTKIVLKELADRKNEQAQKQAVQFILASCKDYSPGVVFFETLLSDYVSLFEPPALYDLLAAMPAHIMVQGMGDSADLLFIPALKNAQNEELQNQLIALFFSYKEGSVYYNGKEYFDTLLSEIKANTSSSVQERLDAEDVKRKEAALIRPSDEAMVQIINIIDQNKASEQFYDTVFSQIEQIELNEHVVAHTFDGFMKANQYDRKIGAFIFNLWLERSPNKAQIYVDQLINSDQSDTPVGNIMIHDFYNIMSGQLPFSTF